MKQYKDRYKNLLIIIMLCFSNNFAGSLKRNSLRYTFVEEHSLVY